MDSVDPGDDGHMPEGDTVWLAARRLHDALAGRVLLRSDLRVPRLATVDLSGRTVIAVVPRGKHLLTRVEGDLTLHTHLRMDGSWHLYRHGDRWRGGADHQVRAVLANAEWQAVGYRLPVVELVATSAEADVVGHLGPDLLGREWHVPAGDAPGVPPGEVEALQRLTAQPDREIGDALLDQRIVAGIGNLYKTETLFLRGVFPWQQVGDVVDPGAMIRLARRLLMMNRDFPEQITTGDTRRGREHWVFERAGRPCRRCGTTIREARQGTPPYDRITYWCPSCQPA